MIKNTNKFRSVEWIKQTSYNLCIRNVYLASATLEHTYNVCSLLTILNLKTTRKCWRARIFYETVTHVLSRVTNVDRKNWEFSSQKGNKETHSKWTLDGTENVPYSVFLNKKVHKRGTIRHCPSNPKGLILVNWKSPERSVLPLFAKVQDFWRPEKGQGS